MSPREGAVDAIFRFTQALDDNNEELLRSAFLQDGTVDLSGKDLNDASLSIV